MTLPRSSVLAAHADEEPLPPRPTSLPSSSSPPRQRRFSPASEGGPPPAAGFIPRRAAERALAGRPRPTSEKFAVPFLSFSPSPMAARWCWAASSSFIYGGLLCVFNGGAWEEGAIILEFLSPLLRFSCMTE